MRIAALDTETTGLDLWHGCRPFLFGGMDDRGEVTMWRWRVNPLTREIEMPNSDRLAVGEYVDSFDRLIWHNAKFDIRGLEFSGIPLPSDIWERSDDTLIAAHCIRSTGSHELKPLALEFCDILDSDEKALRTACLQAQNVGRNIGWRIATAEDSHWPTQKQGSWWKADCWLPGEMILRQPEEYDFSDCPDWDTVCETYATKDFERTLGLWLVLRERLQAEGLWEQYEVRRRLLKRTYLMEARGMTLRRFLTDNVKAKHAKLAAHHEEQCFRTVDHKIDNLDSPKQLQSTLFTVLGLPVVKRTKKGHISTDKDVLAALKLQTRSHSRAGWFLRHLEGYRQRSHAAETIDSYERGCFPFHNDYFAKLHCNLNITATDTTRFSSSNPNGQNIAKGEDRPQEFHLRELFGPEPGRVWYSHDYSNIELRIFAYLAEEREFIEAFERGESVHLLIAQELYPDIFCDDFKKKYPILYQWVKNGNFSLIYGAGVKRADATYHVQGAYHKIRRRFKQIDSFMSASQKEATQNGYVTTLGGYRLYIPAGDRGIAAHKAVNYKVQGSAGWAMCLAMDSVGSYLDKYDDHHMIMQVHDELLTDVPAVHHSSFPHDIKRIMELSGDALGLPLPVEMNEITVSWDDESPVPPRFKKPSKLTLA